MSDDQKKTLKVTLYHHDFAPNGQVHMLDKKPVNRAADMMNLSNLGWVNGPNRPTFMYHRTEAPKGQIFKLDLDPEVAESEIAELEADGWVDTPKKLTLEGHKKPAPASVYPMVKHKGAGKFSVLESENVVLKSGLSKEDAETYLAMIKTPQE